MARFVRFGPDESAGFEGSGRLRIGNARAQAGVLKGGEAREFAPT